MRIAADATPDHVHAQRADAGADERNAHEVPEKHDQRADRAAADRRENQQRPIARAEHRRRRERADVEPEEREDEPEQPVPGGPGDGAAKNEDRDRRNLIGRRESMSSAQNYTSLRPSMALCIVTSSAYSRSLPTGTPIAIRVTLHAERLEQARQIQRRGLAFDVGIGGENDLLDATLARRASAGS